jgi:cell division protein FtsI (penicillin-binding protein 3)
MSRRPSPQSSRRRVPSVERARGRAHGKGRTTKVSESRRSGSAPARRRPPGDDHDRGSDRKPQPGRKPQPSRKPQPGRTHAEPKRSSSPSRRHRGRRGRSGERRVLAAKPPTPPRNDRFGLGASRFRLRLLLGFLLVVLATVLVKVATIQSGGGESLRAAGAEQWGRTTELPADRGSIFDRNGEELAVSIPSYAVSVNPKLVTDEAATTEVLRTMLALDDDAANELYEALVLKETGFKYVQREVPGEVGEQLAGLRLVGVNVDAEDTRVLPGGDTGRSVIGLTDIDGVGIAGLEEQYDDLLTGTPGELRKEVAPRGRSIAGTEQVTSVPVPGDDLILTIDRSIQFATEQALVDRVNELGAKSGYIIVMDTPTGDVLAMSSVQRNDEGIVEITPGNYAATNAYEPGSVSKIVTVAAGLNERTVTPDSTFVVPWRRKYGDDVLSDSHQHPDELMTVEQILVASSNIGTIDVQMSLGRGDWDVARQTHWEYLRRFGFGEPTALDFPGESSGILKHWTDLWGSERVTVAYGQGYAATPIQMAAAINAIANDGVYVNPRLVDGVVDADGNITEADPSDTHDVVRPEVAAEMQSMMRQVVCRGTAKRAQQGLENFSVAGKTGTGLKAQRNGYLNERGERVYYASFAGFFPAEDPQVTVVVSIDEPPAGDINRFGGTAAAPVFGDLVPVIAHELEIAPPPNTTPCEG